MQKQPLDLRDPANWLHIPDFGVQWSAGLIGFRGFMEPKNHPLPEYVRGARSIVRAARTRLRETFTSMNEVRACWLEFLDVKNDLNQLPQKTREAGYYNMVIGSLETIVDMSLLSDFLSEEEHKAGAHEKSGSAALESRRASKEIAAREFLHAGRLFADWMEEWQGGTRRRFSESMRDLAKKPRKRSTSFTAEQLAAYAAKVNYPEQGKYEVFLADAAAHFKVDGGDEPSRSTVRRRLEEAIAKKLMP